MSSAVFASFSLIWAINCSRYIGVSERISYLGSERSNYLILEVLRGGGGVCGGGNERLGGLALGQQLLAKLRRT